MRHLIKQLLDQMQLQTVDYTIAIARLALRRIGATAGFSAFSRLFADEQSIWQLAQTLDDNGSKSEESNREIGIANHAGCQSGLHPAQSPDRRGDPRR